MTTSPYRTIQKAILITGGIFICAFQLLAQNVGIGTTTPHPNAILDISGNNKGLLIPRGDAGSRSVLNSNTAKGLMMYDTLTSTIWIHDGNGLASGWKNLSSGTNHWSLNGALGTEIANTNTGGFWSANPTTVLSDPGPILPPVSGPGTRMMWIPQKSAFRVGSTDGGHWDAPAIGLFSFGGGLNTVSSGSYSLAMSAGTKASGLAATSFGWFTTASGDASTAIGFKTRAKSYASVSIGRFNDSIAISTNNSWIPADPLFMIGNGMSESAPHNAMVVYKNGNMILKNPNPFFVEKLPADYPLPVEGEGTRLMWLPEIGAFRAGSVSGNHWDADFMGLGSFAAGLDARASGDLSTATGLDTKASGLISTAMGEGTISKGYASMAIGMYNDSILIEDQEGISPTTSLFIIGNGDGVAPGQRKNAMVVRKDGRVGIGANAPTTKLDIRGAYSNPSIPSFTSTGVFRMGIGLSTGIDMGIMENSPFSGWIQKGDAGTAGALSLQPLGGNLGVGTTNPLIKLDVRGALGNPTNPGVTSTGIIRIGNSTAEGIDMGIMSESPFSGWIQKGVGGFSEPLSLQPLGGNLGVGTTNPLIKLDVRGAHGNPTIPGATSTGIIRIGNSTAEGIDMGIMGISPFSGWIQKGIGGAAEPLSLQPLGGNVGIGTISPVGAAVLDVSSTTKGFLPPRMTLANRTAIGSPVAGLVIWCTNCGIKGQLQIHNGSAWTTITGSPAVGLPVVGALDGGGIIAYIFQPGDPGYIAGQTHGLIVALNDQTSGEDWGCEGTTIAGADGTAIGTGNQNTIDIMATCSDSKMAARLCGNLVDEGYNDWYLPSKDELNKLYINRIAIGGLATGTYWSSSEVSNNSAWYQIFNAGTQGVAFKDDLYWVRAVRTF